MTAPGGDPPGPALASEQTAAAGPGQDGSVASEPRGVPGDREPRASLLAGEELQRAVARWQEIQAGFVDEPAAAVEKADALVAGLMEQLARMFARERAGLQRQWADGNEVSTEELRQSLRGYRLFFERLLAA